MMSEESNNQLVWKVKLIVGAIMLGLAVLGMIVTDIKSEGAWLYWRVMVPVYALLSIGLSLYLRNKREKSRAWTIWHEILHWIGMLATVYLVSILVRMGFISRYQAGVEVLLLLALATFLEGVYTEPTFMIIGVALGLLIAVIGFLNQYLYFILVPVIVIALALMFWTSKKKSAS